MRSMKTKIAEINSQGSRNTGSKHWLYERLSAFLLIPLIIWFIISIILMIQESTTTPNILDLLSSPLRTIFILIMANLMLYHGMLGIFVIMDDYIHYKPIKIASRMSIYIITILTMISFTISVLTYHFHNIKIW